MSLDKAYPIPNFVLVEKNGTYAIRYGYASYQMLTRMGETRILSGTWRKEGAMFYMFLDEKTAEDHHVEKMKSAVGWRKIYTEIPHVFDRMLFVYIIDEEEYHVLGKVPKLSKKEKE